MNRPEFDAERMAFDAIENAAIDWFGRRDAGLTEAEEVEFQTWLESDPRHAEEYSRLSSTDTALEGLSVFRPQGRKPDPNLPLLNEVSTPLCPKRRWMSPLALAAAAAIALIAGFVVLPRSSHDQFSNVVTTEVGGLRRMVLPDGSTLELNTDTKVAVAFDRAVRRVTLERGEVHFSVAKEPARPFVVSAGGDDVQAVGTAFNVHLRPGDVDVLVTEGRVRVSDTESGSSLLPVAATLTTEPPVLTAGYRAVVAAATAVELKPKARVSPVADLEMSRLLAWQAKRLEFEPTSLREIIAEFNRYNTHQLIAGDSMVEDLSVGGSFAVGDYDMLVRLLEASFNVTAERQAQSTTLRLKR